VKFNWTAEEMTLDWLRLKLLFEKPEADVSSLGMSRDMLKVTVIDPSYFLGLKSHLNVQKNNSITVVLPPMLSSDSF